jgi:alpha-tubulin suppressor-like RCC1 family protein
MHSAAVSSSGDAFLWGYGRFNQLGLGDTRDEASPTPLPALKGGTAALACGSLHTLALLHGGDVMAWGANQASQEEQGADNLDGCMPQRAASLCRERLIIADPAPAARRMAC